jgi:hypothetical protein
MNHPSSIYDAYLKVNTDDGFFWLYCNVEEDYDGAVFTISSNTRNATNPNGTTSFYLESFSDVLTILSNHPLWIINPALMPSHSGSANSHAVPVNYDFYDSRSNLFATVTLVLPSPIMEKKFYGLWHGNLAKSYTRPQSHFVLASDKLKSTYFSHHFNFSRDPKKPSVAIIDLNPDEPDDCITLSMPVSNQPVTGQWVYATDAGTVESGTFKGPVR